LEVVNTGRRRRWTLAEKLRIVEESFRGYRQVSATARRHDISPSLLFSWRKALREGCRGDDEVVGFAPALIRPDEGPRPSDAGSGRGCRCPGAGAGGGRAGGAVIPVPSGVRVWLATGATDMRRGMNGLTLQVQEAMGRDPHAGDLYVFRGRRGNLIKVLWHDGLGCSLYAKRLERGRFIWPSPADGVVAISSAQLGYLLEGIDWRNPLRTWRPERAG
jgi:transposase